MLQGHFVHATGLKINFLGGYIQFIYWLIMALKLLGTTEISLLLFQNLQKLRWLDYELTTPVVGI